MSDRFALAAGTVLDRKYRIERVIGAGGFGITYKAFNQSLGIHVAVKEYFPAQYGVRDSTMSVRPRTEIDHELFDRMQASFQREARTLASLDHPAIVRVLNTFEAHGTSYMVMRFEAGQSFKHWLEGIDGRPGQEQLDAMLGPLLSALETIHSRDYLHRDIAPDNIIVRPDGQPVLIDFGASRRVVGDLTGIMTGIVKTGYSPQEQYVPGSRLLGPWSDIYALGATLYLAVTGKKPVDASARVLKDVMVPAKEAGHGHGYRPEFLAAIDWAMAIKPAARPQSIAEWRARLLGPAVERTAGKTQAHAAQNGPADRMPHTAATPPGVRVASFDDIAPPPAVPQARQSRSALLLTIGILLVVLGGGLLMVMGASALLRPFVGEASRVQSGTDIASPETGRRPGGERARADEAPRRTEAPRRAEIEERRSEVAGEAPLIVALQRELARAGCDPGPEDGQWGLRIELALERFADQTKASIVTDVPTAEALRAVQERPGRVCTCPQDEVEVGDRCVARSEAAGAAPVARAAGPRQPDEERPRRERRKVDEDGAKSRRRQSDADNSRPAGRACDGFPPPQIGETCVRRDGKACIWEGGSGTCN